jgi:hypothetical protein
MLNQLTLRDYETRIQKFDFNELVLKEHAADIAKAVFQKAKKNPLHSEFYVKIVLSSIRKAYITMNGADQSVS